MSTPNDNIKGTDLQDSKGDKKYTAKVKWNGNHYHSGEIVSGSKYRVVDGVHEIYDDEENYVAGLGDFTRYEWVEIDADTLQEVKK